MHARDLVELAALVAVHSPALVQGAGGVPSHSQEEYWAASRCRLDRWTRVLRQLANSAGEFPKPATLAWPRVRPLLEEILAGELLTRLWTAAAVAYDQSREQSDLEPIARNVLAGHLEARRSLLALLADGRTFDEPQAVWLNNLRRRVERWTDMLLAHLAREINIAEFAFETDRARDFAADLALPANSAQRQFTSQLVLASLRASFETSLADRSPSADLNRRIGSAVMAFFRDELVAIPVPTPSLWLERIAVATSDAQGMIDELVAIDN